jgi:hypothetical protein
VPRSKKLLLALFILPVICFGQTYSDSYDLIYGYMSYKKNFYGKSLSSHYMGVGISDHHAISRNTMTGYFSGGYAGTYLLPQDVTVSDSVKTKFSGYSFSLDYGIVPIRGRKFRLFIYSGFITGNNYLKFENSSYRNPFFCPKICIRPKLFLGKVSLAVTAGFNLDISKTHWMRRKGETYEIKGFDQTSLNFQFHLCFRPW